MAPEPNSPPVPPPPAYRGDDPHPPETGRIGPPIPHFRPAPRKHPTGLYVLAAVAAALLLGGAVIFGYVIGAGQRSTPTAAPTPTCEIVGVNGCETKVSDGGGPVDVPTANSTPPPTSAAPAPPAVPTIDDGTWTVGQDFPAGTYRTTTAGADCYWAITKSGTNGSDIINNHVGAGHLTVTLKAGQDFETERCGTWTKV